MKERRILPIIPTGERIRKEQERRMLAEKEAKMKAEIKANPCKIC